MRIMAAKILTHLLLAAAAFSGVQAQGEAIPRVQLPGEASVAGTQILLSDLLPRSAPEDLHVAAAQVSLGRAPQPGRVRWISRGEIERVVLAHPGPFNRLAIPERIAVSSAARAITADEAYQAISGALDRNGFPAGASLHPSDVHLGAQIFVHPGDPGLRVTRMDLDPTLGQARFLLWPANDPGVVPFFVTARLGPASRSRLALGALASAPSLPEGAPAKSATGAARARTAQQVILVQPGQRTLLTLRNATMRISVEVTPLERGSLGQQIRVRMTQTDKIVTAEVTGRAQLEGQL